MAIGRLAVPSLDRIIGKRFPVLDDGFVRLVDYMGGDAAIVQAARVSYGAGTRRVRTDRALIRYLMRHRHTTPFEMCELKLHVRVPMDTWRQWIRHRTASVNEYSTRYSVAIDSAQRTPPRNWRQQSSSARQGSSGNISGRTGVLLSRREAQVQRLARNVYEERLEAGVAREQARKDLPLSTYTEAYWKIDLHNLLHFLELRLAPSAQPEIRAYAQVIATDLVAAWCPLTYAAFQDFRVGSIDLSAVEADLTRVLAHATVAQGRRLCVTSGLVRREPDGSLMLTGEGHDFASKLRRLGLESVHSALTRVTGFLPHRRAKPQAR